jgi:hypothetical protein
MDTCRADTCKADTCRADTCRADTCRADTCRADTCRADTCSAESYGHCTGQINEYTYFFHYKQQVSKNVILCHDDEEHHEEQIIKVNICAFHRNWILCSNQGKEPEVYGWNIEDALDSLFYCCQFKDKYTFWHCTVHDDGVLIKDQNTDEVPEWYCKSMCRSEPGAILHNPCEQIDWYKKGVINYDGKMVAELEPLNMTEYTHKVGAAGFKFEYYSYEYIVKDEKKEKGKNVIFEENTPIKWWFQFKINSLL